MDLRLQKRLAADVLKVSEKRIEFDPARLVDIGEAITKTDIRELVGEGVIKNKQKKGVSRSRANKRQTQKRKGLRKGQGSRKGSPTSRLSQKQRWSLKVRSQREFIKELKDKEILTSGNYRLLYNMVKGGFFRSKRHIKLFIKERGLSEVEEK